MKIITQAYRETLFNNNKGANDSTLVTHANFISSYEDPSDFDNLSTLPVEIDRIVLTTGNMSFTNKEFTFNFDIPEANCVCPTTSISSKDSTNTLLTLNDASSFAIGNLIEVETSLGYLETGIVAKSGNTITIKEPLAVSIGSVVRKKVSHIGILINASITISSTDLIMLWIKQAFFKDSTAKLNEIYKYELL